MRLYGSVFCSDGKEYGMKRIRKALIVLVLSAFTLSGCGIGPEEMIGPRTESAWNKWEEDQKSLVETWGETEIYAYITAIMDDMYQVNAGVIFGDGFSPEEETPEADAFRKLCSDMNLGDGITPEAFLEWLDDSMMRYAVGGPCELDSITERKEEDGGGYDVRLVYYAGADSLMALSLPVTTDADGQFTLIELVSEE